MPEAHISHSDKFTLSTYCAHCYTPLKVDRKRGRGIHDFDLKLRIVLEKRLKIKYHMSSRKLAIALI